MPTATTVRRITPAKQRNFGRIYDVFPVPDLTEIQTRSYERFLQADIPAEQRIESGLEGVFREIFPIESYGDKTLRLEYIKFDLGKPRYEPDECRQLRLTFGRPLHVWLRLNKGETAIEESVYLGDMPIMIGGGEFIINGAERVVVSQLHRSPGVDFVVEIEAGDRKLHACRIIPERGSWIELQVTKKETLGVRIDQSGKFSAMTLLRAMSPQYSSDEEILAAFYETETVSTGDPKAASKLEGRIACGDVVDPTTGEVLIESGMTISKTSAQILADAQLGAIAVLKEAKDPLILQSLQEDPTTDHESALLRIYQRLRPGNPPQLEKAKELFHEKFFDTNRYRLGKVGRFRINRKFNQDDPRGPDDPGPDRLRQRDPVHPQPPQGEGPRRRHRPPGQPPAPDDRRAGRRRAPQGVPQAPPDRPGADEPQGRRGHDAAVADQPQEHQRGDRVLLRPGRAVAGRRPDQPAGAADPRAPALGAGPGRPEPEARRVRGPRRAHLALRPDLPDRDPRGDQHRPDQLAGHLRRRR